MPLWLVLTKYTFWKNIWGKAHIPPSPVAEAGEDGWRKNTVKKELKPKARHPALSWRRVELEAVGEDDFCWKTSRKARPLPLKPGKHAWSWFTSAWHQLGGGNTNQRKMSTVRGPGWKSSMGSLPKPQCCSKGSKWPRSLRKKLACGPVKTQPGWPGLLRCGLAKERNDCRSLDLAGLSTCQCRTEQDPRGNVPSQGRAPFAWTHLGKREQLKAEMIEF